MFGYITINEAELKIKDYRIYRSFYCGICRDLRQSYGLSGNLMLNYDLTFVALLLTALYEEESLCRPHRCFIHPLKRGAQSTNRFTRYAADMTILLAYYQCLDHWRDERNIASKAEAMLLKRHLKRIGKTYPRQKKAVDDYVKELSEAEVAGSGDLDLVAGATGSMLGEILVEKEDEWAALLRQTGFYLGKFIYLMDAYEDLEKDREKGCYNPLLARSGEENFKEECETMLTSMMAECARRFERLPVLRYADILRNILYSGVWRKYEVLQKKRQKENGNGPL